MATCEDYPCCGHTPDDPCSPQPYDAPGYYDVTRPGNEHALCDHESGECYAEDIDGDDELEFDPDLLPNCVHLDHVARNRNHGRFVDCAGCGVELGTWDYTGDDYRIKITLHPAVSVNLG